MIEISTAEKKNLQNILALFHKQMLCHHKSNGSNVGINFLAHLILHPLKDGRCAFYSSIDQSHIVDFYLCILFISKISPHLKILKVQSKEKCSRCSILELSQSFEDWFKAFGKYHQEQKPPYFDQLNDHIHSAQNIAVHSLFREEPQKISSVVSRLNNFLHSLLYKPDPLPWDALGQGEWRQTASLRYKKIPVEMLEPYNAIISRTNRIQNDVENMANHARKKKKKRPKLNYHTKDDTIHYDAIQNVLQQVDCQELENIGRKAYDESETSGEGDVNCNEQNNQGTQVGTESYASEDDATFDSQVIDNIAEGFTYLFSLEDEEESASEWDILSEPQCEWEIMSDVRSVQSFGENECMFTYKDAVQMQMNSASALSSPSKVNIFYKTIESPPLARTCPISTTKVTDEDKDHEDNAEFDAYFEYDAYKGGRGGKPFRWKRISNDKTRHRL